jgi:hypothetical protein
MVCVMAKREQLPTVHALRALGIKHQVDPRTVLRALKGESIRTGHAHMAAHAAAAEWRVLQAAPQMVVHDPSPAPKAPTKKPATKRRAGKP